MMVLVGLVDDKDKEDTQYWEPSNLTQIGISCIRQALEVAAARGSPPIAELLHMLAHASLPARLVRVLARVKRQYDSVTVSSFTPSAPLIFLRSIGVLQV